MENYQVQIRFDVVSDKDIDILYKLVDQEVNKATPNVFLTNKVIVIKKCKEREKRIVLGEFSLDEVLPHVSDECKYVKFVGDKEYLVKMNRSRYIVFRDNPNCIACGLKGTKFLLETYHESSAPHFNLYGYENSTYILMTKDHILPKSRGGKNALNNYVTMCAICNNLKGNEDFTAEEIKLLRQVYNNNKNLTVKARAKLINEIKSKIKESKNEQIQPLDC